MKKIIKNTLTALLVTSMLLSMAACKKNGVLGGIGGGGSVATAKEEQVKEDAIYYNADEHEIQLKLDSSKAIDWSNLGNPKIVGDKIFSTYSISYKMPTEVMEKLYNLNYDDPEAQKEAEKIYSEYYHNGLGVFDLNGNMLFDVDLPAGAEVTSFALNSKNEIYALAAVLNDEICSTDMALYKIDSDGNATKAYDLENGEDIYMGYNMFFDENDNLFTYDYGCVSMFDTNGKSVFSKSVEGLTSVFFYDGKLYGIFFDIKDFEYVGSYAQEINLTDGEQVGDKKQMDLDQMFGFTSSRNGFYSTNGEGLLKIDPINGTKEPVMSWNDADFNYTGILTDSIEVVSDDDIYLFRSDYEEIDGDYFSHTILVHLTKAASNPHSGQKIITIGSYNQLNSELVDYIVAYNKDTTHKAKINVSDLSASMDVSLNDYDKQMAELSDKIYLDMLAGTGPDILIDFSEFSQFNSDEILVDLNKYIDGDNGLNRAEYFDNIFRAFETNGKLYQIPICCDINGLIANKELVGDRTGWTYDEFMQIAQSLPGTVQMFDNMSYEEVLSAILSNNMTAFVDYEKKSVDFESEDFRKILEIAKTYGVQKMDEKDSPMPIADGGYEGDAITDGIVAAQKCYIYTLGQYADQIARNKGNVEFVGYPSASATGMSAAPMMTMAIAATSPSQDEAWEFISYMFEHDSQESFSKEFLSIPISRQAFDNICEAEVKSYEQRMAELQTMSDDMKDKWTETVITRDMIAGYRSLVESVNSMSSTDQAVLNIINEEAAAYFAGQRTVEDVCRNIQNRANTIVQERG